jgi:hypothetical protein
LRAPCSLARAWIGVVARRAPVRLRDRWTADRYLLEADPDVPLPLETACHLADRCDIKGNINSKGERIYHVPGSRYYAATVIDTTRGERWFCSEGGARAAGWRPPKH